MVQKRIFGIFFTSLFLVGRDSENCVSKDAVFNWIKGSAKNAITEPWLKSS